MRKKEETQIIYFDDDVIVVDKPSGMLSIPGRFDNLTALSEILEKQFGQIFVVHRLDKETSGVMIFARTKNSHRKLNLQFDSHEILRIYHVLVKGIFSKDKLNIDIPITSHPGKKAMMIPSARGKASLTKVSVLERFRHATLMEADLRTGRQHQIRVHFSSVGHPLLVDPLYGTDDSFYVSSVKRKFNLKKNTVEQPILKRLSMHSSFVSFKHPSKEEILEFEAAYPKDFRATINILRKYSAY